MWACVRPDFLRYCAALILGSLLPLAFAPFYWWPLAILIPALLIWLIDAETDLRKLFVFGGLFGLGYFGFGVYWIYNSLHDFGMAPPVVASAITALMVCVLALFPASILLSLGYSKRHLGQRSLWLLPLFWFTLEWIKGWIFTGMPWLSLGYSQTGTPLSGFASVVGVYGISAVCILMAVTLYRVIHERRYKLIGLLLALPLGGMALQNIDWTEAVPGTLKVTLVQGNIPQQIKWRHDQRQNIFNTYWRETTQHWDSDLIVWPETALPGHSGEIEEQVLQPMQQTAIEQKTAIITGLIVNDDETGNFYNSVMLLGEERSIYHKRHLVMFGEYYPLRWLLDILRGLISIPYSDLTSGPEQQEPMRIGDLVLGISICFEDVFSRDIMLALPQANLLINLSNDAWFGNSTAPHQHMQIAQMRSLESGRAMIRSTNTGISTFIDYKGQIVAQTEQFKTESLTRTVQGRTGITPFYYFAKVQGPLSVFLFVGLLLFARRKAA
jgi:apolipoprotein N-acyltransferase